MASQNNAISGDGYGNLYIDSLAWGCGWDLSDGPIRYAFGAGTVPALVSSIGAFTGQTWTIAEKNAFSNALNQYEAVCNLTFVLTNSTSSVDTDIVWWKTGGSYIGSNVLGIHEVPDESTQPIYGYFNSDYFGALYGSLNVGSYSYITLIHELGHGLGLAHPHDGGGEVDATKFPRVNSPWSMGSNNLNQGIWTTMSYIDGWNIEPSTSNLFGWQGTPMAFDIAALQALYGANMSTATGDDLYLLPSAKMIGTYWACLWDAGGIDTISNAGSSMGATINLNAAPLLGANAGGYVSWIKGVPGGYTIANKVVIENAIGGNGVDNLIGNNVDNVLNGGGGGDIMNGGLGNDTYIVDNINDKILEMRNAGNDSVLADISWSLGAELESLTLLNNINAVNAVGNALANILRGNDYDNFLSGGSGKDILIGQKGVDVLSGGRGADIFVYSYEDSAVGVGNRDVITDFVLSQGDQIDLSAVAHLNWVGKANFNGELNQLRFDAGVLMADLDGDLYSDFEIQLTGVSNLATSCLIL